MLGKINFDVAYNQNNNTFRKKQSEHSFGGGRTHIHVLSSKYVVNVHVVAVYIVSVLFVYFCRFALVVTTFVVCVRMNTSYSFISSLKTVSI